MWYGSDKIGGGRLWKFEVDGSGGTYGGVDNGTEGTAVSRKQ